jgi:hypothetical protein
MAPGPLPRALIYDALASYTGLYVGSGAMGIGAFLIALTPAGFARSVGFARA